MYVLWTLLVAPCMAYHMEHLRVLRHVWYRNGTIWTNDSDILAHLDENPNFFSFPVRYADAFPDTVRAGQVLLFGKDYNWRVWYHLLFDASLPILHTLHTQYNLLTNPEDRALFTVAFANRQEESLIPVFAEFWELFTDTMYTDGVVWDRARERAWGLDAALYYDEMVFVSKELPYPELTQGAVCSDSMLTCSPVVLQMRCHTCSWPGSTLNSAWLPSTRVPTHPRPPRTCSLSRARATGRLRVALRNWRCQCYRGGDSLCRSQAWGGGCTSSGALEDAAVVEEQ